MEKTCEKQVSGAGLARQGAGRPRKAGVGPFVRRPRPVGADRGIDAGFQEVVMKLRLNVKFCLKSCGAGAGAGTAVSETFLKHLETSVCFLSCFLFCFLPGAPPASLYYGRGSARGRAPARGRDPGSAGGHAKGGLAGHARRCRHRWQEYRHESVAGGSGGRLQGAPAGQGLGLSLGQNRGLKPARTGQGRPQNRLGTARGVPSAGAPPSRRRMFLHRGKLFRKRFCHVSLRFRPPCRSAQPALRPEQKLRERSVKARRRRRPWPECRTRTACRADQAGQGAGVPDCLVCFLLSIFVPLCGARGRDVPDRPCFPFCPQAKEPPCPSRA